MTAVTAHALALAIAFVALGCGKRPSGACRDDLDCPPGFDCASGVCSHRARLEFSGAGGTPTTPPEPEAPAAAPPRPVEMPPPPSPLPAPAVKPKGKPIQVPEPAPAPAPAPAVPEQRLPAWKQRLKNT
jgi:hypothetical protein